MEEHLVRAQEVVLRRPGDRLLDRHVVGTEGVVVEEEERRQDRGRPGAWPGDVRVLGGQHAELPAERHQALVLRLAARLVRVHGDDPQVVVARHPEEAREAPGEDGEREAEVLLGLADVAGQDQPVFRMGSEGLESLPGHLVAQVEVGQGVELQWTFSAPFPAGDSWGASAASEVSPGKRRACRTSPSSVSQNSVSGWRTGSTEWSG